MLLFLWSLTFQIYVEYVVKNPLCRLDEPIQSELFASKLDAFIRSLPIFNWPLLQSTCAVSKA